MKRYLIFFLFLISCSTNQNYLKVNSNFNFSNDLSFEEFEIKVEEYAINSPFPNIDN